jgi:hypothetical protein
LKTLLVILGFLIGTLGDITYAQVTCAQLGVFTDCSGPGHRSTTQVDLGNGMGVIIGPITTTPYTVLPSSPRAASRHSTVPTFLYGAEPSSSPYEISSASVYELPSVPTYELPSAPSGYGQ